MGKTFPQKSIAFKNVAPSHHAAEIAQAVYAALRFLAGQMAYAARLPHQVERRSLSFPEQLDLPKRLGDQMQSHLRH
jgi:hypothetical protein